MSLNYTTVERIFDQEPLLEDATLISSAQIALFAQDAEAEIDGVLASRYAVPISGSPPLLRTVATKLTVGLILSERVFTQERLQESEWPKAFIDGARGILDRLLTGQMTLVDSAGTVVTGRNDLGEVWSNTAGYHPTFAEIDPSRQVVDPDKIEAIESERDLLPIPGRMLK